jgi:hypothetical protein
MRVVPIGCTNSSVTVLQPAAIRARAQSPAVRQGPLLELAEAKESSLLREF